MIVLDASVLIEILLRTQRGVKIEETLSREASVFQIPHLLDLEVAQVLRRHVRQRQMSPERAMEALEDLLDFPLVRYPHARLLPRIWELRENLTAYDAAYIALAEALDAPLVTCDARLKRASGHSAQIKLWS